MKEISKVSPEVAQNIINDCDAEIYLVLENDLESNSMAIRSRLNKKKVLMIIPKAKSIIANIDDEEDSISTLSLYSHIQQNPKCIEKKGTKKEILLISDGIV